MQGSHSWEHLQSSIKTSRLSAVTEIVLHNCDPVSSQMGTASWLSTLIQMFSSCTRKGNVAFYKLVGWSGLFAMFQLTMWFGTQAAYQLHVSLVGTRVWRRLLVPNHLTLMELHLVLNSAVG